MSTHPTWPLTLQPRHLVIGEVKSRSPFGPASYRSRYETLAWLDTWADVISIHTDPFWGGSWEWLAEARRRTKRPILAKGFHPSAAHVARAFSEGADYVLTVGWWPGDPLCWMEAESLSQIHFHPEVPRMVWNARDPRTGKVRPESWKTVRMAREDRWLCQASCIRRAEDAYPDAQALLIGEALN